METGPDRPAPAGGEGLPEKTFLGVRLTALDIDAAARWIAARPPTAPFAYILTPNAQNFVVLERGDDPRFTSAYAGAAMRLCDSRVVRALARICFGIGVPLVPGSDLTAALFAHTIQPDDAVTVIGGSEVLAERLRRQFGLTRLAMHIPPMGFVHDPAAVAACAHFIRDNPGRYVFIAVGVPQAEIVAAEAARLPGTTGCGLCVGGSLLFLTGLRRRAPHAWRRLGLEWLYRLAQNPRSHARRVFVDSLPLLFIVAREKLGWRRPPPGTEA